MFSESVTFRSVDGTLRHVARVGVNPYFDNSDGMQMFVSRDDGASFSCTTRPPPTFFPPASGGGFKQRTPDDGAWSSCRGNTPLPTLGSTGEMYNRLLRLHDGRVLMAFTVRCGRDVQNFPTSHHKCTTTTDGFNIGMRAVLSTDDGASFSFDRDRMVIDAQPAGPPGGRGDPSGGGYGNTVQLPDGVLVTPYSYRKPGSDGYAVSAVVRWKLPPPVKNINRLKTDAGDVNTIASRTNGSSVLWQPFDRPCFALGQSSDSMSRRRKRSAPTKSRWVERQCAMQMATSLLLD